MNLTENLLSSWLRLTTIIDNERIVSEMPYNETIVCNILYRHMLEQTDSLLTATDLCQRTHMVKSLMNRTLNSMEEQNLIERIRSNEDKRKVYIKLNENALEGYLKQHSQILELIDCMIQKFGKEKAIEIMNIFDAISDIASEVIK